MSTSVAVIGCGYWGRNLVRNFHEIGALAAVCDADAEVAAGHATPVPLVPMLRLSKPHQVAVVAMARELVGFIWAAMRDVPPVGQRAA